MHHDGAQWQEQGGQNNAHDTHEITVRAI